MFPLDASKSLCNRIQKSRNRGDSIEASIVEEYFGCFNRVRLTQRQHRALMRCMESAVILAHATVIPILFPDALNKVPHLHPVIRAICELFFQHLRHSWLSLENPRVEEMYVALQKNA